MNRIIQRIINNSNTYQDVLSVYNRLSEKDKLLVSPQGKFIDSPNLVSREVKYVNNEPVGFCEAYKYNGKTDKAFIIVAVLDEYRGNNIATELIQKTANNCFNQNYKTIIYRCDSNNIPSKNLAIKNNFSLVKKTNNQLCFELHKSLNNNTYLQSPYQNQNQYSYQYPYPYQYQKYPYYPYYMSYPYYYDNYYNNNEFIDNNSTNINDDITNINNDISNDIGSDIGEDDGGE